jgi:dephospho-CoA kinase
MMVVVLTGGIGSGKSEAARLFAGLGVPVVDTDVIAHQLTAPGQPALLRIAQAFGAEILDADGALRRDQLRQRVFTDPQSRKALEEILHPPIREHVFQELARHPDATYQIVVVPLLFETGSYANLIQRSLVIDCDEALQVGRAMARGRLTEPEVRAIMAAQLPRNQRLAMTDDVIVNDGSLDQLAARVRDQHEKYIQACIVSHSIS